MKKYYVLVRETLERVIEVEAENEDRATCIAERKYRNGEFILSAEDFVDVEFFVEDNEPY